MLSTFNLVGLPSIYPLSRQLFRRHQAANFIKPLMGRVNFNLKFRLLPQNNRSSYSTTELLNTFKADNVLAVSCNYEDLMFAENKKIVIKALGLREISFQSARQLQIYYNFLLAKSLFSRAVDCTCYDLNNKNLAFLSDIYQTK